MSDWILFGAGACGQNTLKYMREHGQEPIAFADNDSTRWGTKFHSVPVLPPKLAKKLNPEATFVVTIYDRSAKDVRRQLEAMNAKTAPINSLVPVYHGLPTASIEAQLRGVVTEPQTLTEISDQLLFRRTLNYDLQIPPTDKGETYFPDFISKNPEEVYIDCGAYDGDSIRQFLKTRTAKEIIAFEPDYVTFNKLLASTECTALRCALGSYTGTVPFVPTGWMDAHVDKDAKSFIPCVRCVRLDELDYQPTFIKMDIEGSEIEALQGSRGILQKYKPVLAICAYHKGPDLWEIPLLIHSIQPSYDLRLRRYAEGPWELVWYAVPPGRIK